MIDLQALPEHIRPGSTIKVGEFTFTKTDILRFAKAWDPQPFHTDEEAAKTSILGGLCASGWHTVSIWMKFQRASIASKNEVLQREGKAFPEFGPSPGMKEIKWLRPVFAGDTISYSNEILDVRESSSQPGWYIMTSKIIATNQNAESVMTFNSAVFLRLVN